MLNANKNSIILNDCNHNSKGSENWIIDFCNGYVCTIKTMNDLCLKLTC